jgi:hypothetical protein
MGSPTTKAPTPTLKAGPASPLLPEIKRDTPVSTTADYVYRIAAMTAGIALLMTVV